MTRIIAAAALATALCACTSQQYAQFNQRVEDSISHALTTQAEPPRIVDGEAEAAAESSLPPSPVPSVTIPTPIPRVTFTPKPRVKQPIAKGGDLVDGAIVCPSLDEVIWLYNRIGSARVARTNMPPQNRQLVMLQDGYDPWEEPDPADYRCQFVPAGTPMNVKWEGGLPVVSGKTADGRPFAGITNPVMIDR